MLKYSVVIFFIRKEKTLTELRDVIAKNIYELRTSAEMTQLALAEVLNYSDKAVSKWERAESVPDVFMLKRIADYFGVTIDYLLTADHTETKQNKISGRTRARTHFIISFLAMSLVWLIATTAFVLLHIFAADSAFPAWMTFLYAVPISSVVGLVFNSIWGKSRLNYAIISILIWSFLLSIFLTSILIWSANIWPIFLVGAPGQVIVILWSGINTRTPINT